MDIAKVLEHKVEDWCLVKETPEAVKRVAKEVGIEDEDAVDVLFTKLHKIDHVPTEDAEMMLNIYLITAIVAKFCFGKLSEEQQKEAEARLEKAFSVGAAEVETQESAARR